MKKHFWILLILIFIFATIVGSTETYSAKITAWFYDIKINVNDSPLNFVNKPFVYNGQTYVSVNELSRYLGYDVQMDRDSNTIDLVSSQNDQVTLETLQYQLDKKNMEISNLKLQLQQKDYQLSILRDTSYDDYYYRSGSADDVLEELEEYLEDHYDSHRNNGRSMEFTYDLSQLSSDDIKVEMHGDFDRNDREWYNRNVSDFKDFVLDISKEIDKEFNEDIRIYVYDEDDSTCARYTYDHRDKDFSSTYNYRSSSDSTDDILEELEEYLEDHYDSHRNNGRSMEFTYDLSQLSSDDIKLEMHGDFDRDSREWYDRDVSDFEDFVLDISKEIDKEFNEDIKIYVYDKDDSTCARYTYDHVDEDFSYTYDYR